VPDLIAIMDDRHRIVRANRAMAERLGVTPHDCAGQECYLVVHGSDHPPGLCPHALTLADGLNHQAEVHEERLDGHFLVTTTPLLDERGAMIGSVHVARDITERKRVEEALRESEERVRRKLDSILSPEGDMGDLELADIIDVPGLQSLMKDLYRLSGTPVGIVDLEGKVLVGVGWQDICTKFHRVHPETCGNCMESDLHLSAGIPQGEFKLYKCKNNLWDAATPIIVGDKHCGNLFLGQFFFEEEQPDYEFFRSQAQRYGFDEDEYLAALGRVPRLSRDSLNAAMDYFMKFAAILSRLSYGNLKLARSLSERETLTESLREAHDELEKRVALRTEELARTINDLRNEINEREKAEVSILRLNRLYEVLSGTNQTIVRAADRDMLFHDFCRIAVEEGAFLLSWIGLVDGESGEVRTVAARGATGYLDDIRITAGEEPAGLGPTGISIRDGSHYICNDFQNDPCTAPWHERGAAYGIQSSASVALHEGGRVIGALTLYAAEKDFFKGEQVALLQQMGGDISFALDNLERERLLQESERKFRSLFEESKDMIYFQSAAGFMQDVNPAGTDLFGYTRKEFAALAINELYCDPQARERFLRMLFESGYVRDFETQMKSRDGEVLHVLQTASVTRNEKGEITAYRGIVHDMTERKRLEQQLIQSQKMESIGLLAGGIAHDFNNLLTAILGYGQIMQQNVTGTDEMLQMCADQILSAAGRATDLTRSLLAFGRKQIIDPRPVSVNDIIVNVTKLLTRIIGEDIELGTSLASRHLTVMADSTQIDQVLINLATNARDAMSKGGRLSIRTEEVDLSNEQARLQGLDTGGCYALIKVTDTGTGMEEKTRERIFEPFFTTKEVGQGTGLGLAISYGIVKQHNGTISVESAPGEGTTFAIHLPIVKLAASEEEVRAAAPLPRGTETLLVAEDDPVVRCYTKKVLEMAGYTVLAAHNGADAVEQFRENQHSIALVLCDVVMPKMNGKEVCREIRTLQPQARVIFTSGYNDEIIHSKGVLEEGIDFLQKPVSRKELLEKIRLVLDGRA
jgi:PAS domain S-box-containing protein